MQDQELPAPDIHSAAENQEHRSPGDDIPGRILKVTPRRVDRAVFVLDMSGFTSSVRRHGIEAYIDKIRRMQDIAIQVVPRHGGEIIKFAADNAFALFADSRAAIAAAADFQNVVRATNGSLAEAERIKVAIGIAWGEVIIMPWRDIFGDAVNIASKLGEDVAKGGEILVDDQIGREAAAASGCHVELLRIRISGVSLQVYRLVPA